MPIETAAVYLRQILIYLWLSSIKKAQKTSEMKILTKIYQEKLECWTESIEIGISEHGTFSSDSIENKVIATMKGGFYFTIAYNKCVR